MTLEETHVTTLIPSADTTGRPEPVLDAAKLAAAVSGTVLAVGAAFVLVGWVTADQVQNWAVIAGGIVTSIGTLLAVAMPIITAIGARAQVTPLSDPQGMQGQPLPITPGYPTAPDLDDQPGTTELPAVGAWRPATPAAVAHEPTPIAAEAEAAATGRPSPEDR